MYPDGSDYVGDVSVTETGLECQRWDSQTPHSHSHSDADFPEKDLSLTSNYCRNPSGRSRPWCYTTDKDIEWDYCKLWRCHTGTDATMFYHVSGQTGADDTMLYIMCHVFFERLLLINTNILTIRK